jgi:hypothetical protein
MLAGRFGGGIEYCACAGGPRCTASAGNKKDSKQTDEEQIREQRAFVDYWDSQVGVNHNENTYLQQLAGMLYNDARATREPFLRGFVRTPGFDQLTTGADRETMAVHFWSSRNKYVAKREAAVPSQETIGERRLFPEVSK